MKKLLLFAVLTVLGSCGMDEDEIVRSLKEKNPDATIMTTGDNDFYVVDSVKIRKYTYSNFTLRKNAITGMKTLRVKE